MAIKSNENIAALPMESAKCQLLYFNPKADLTKATVDTAAQTIVDSKIFATTEGGNLTALKSSQIVTRKVETLE